GMLVAQIGVAQRSAHRDGLAANGLPDGIATGAVADVADVELEQRLAGRIGHRIVARRQRGEAELRILPGAEIEAHARRRFKSQDADVVRRIFEIDDATGELHQSLHWKTWTTDVRPSTGSG